MLDRGAGGPNRRLGLPRPTVEPRGPAAPAPGRADRAWSGDRSAPGARMRRLRPPRRVSEDHALEQRRVPRGPPHLREGRLSPGARGAPPQLRARARVYVVGAYDMSDPLELKASYFD